MEKNHTFSLARRGFLKGVSALAVATVSTGAVGNLSATAQNTSMKKTSQFTYQLCPRNCHDTCTLISETVDGKIVRVTGDPKPHHRRYALREGAQYTCYKAIRREPL